MVSNSEDQSIRQPVVLVTGISSGIGLALARMLWASTQYRVVVTARAQSLSKIKNEPFRDNSRFRVRPLDVTSAAEREALLSELCRDWGGVDILVNNAGIAYRAVFEHMTDAELEAQFATNFLGPMALMRQLLPHMRSRGSGRIINVSSVSGMMAMPTMASYSASKFALEGATEAIWYEMRPWNIKVTLVQPGFIRSESFKNVYLSELARRSNNDPADPYHRYYRYMRPFIEKMMGRALSTPEKVAQVILNCMAQKNPPLRVFATVDAWLFGIMRRILPRFFYHELLYFCLPGIKHWRQK